IVVKIDAAFSTVSINPNVSSESEPTAKIPWCGHITTLNSLILAAVASPILFVPGVIYGIIPMPSGKTATDSACIFHRIYINHILHNYTQLISTSLNLGTFPDLYGS